MTTKENDMQVPEWLHPQVAEILAIENEAVELRRSPHVYMRPRVFLDGDKWCALYGKDLQEGVVGFGDTPEKACADFDYSWQTGEAAPEGAGHLKPPPIVLTWDWKESPGEVIESVVWNLRKLEGGAVYAQEHQSRNDEFCLVLSNAPLTADEAKAAYEKRWDEED
jgi:hypothetical protein